MHERKDDVHLQNILKGQCMGQAAIGVWIEKQPAAH